MKLCFFFYWFMTRLKADCYKSIMYANKHQLKATNWVQIKEQTKNVTQRERETKRGGYESINYLSNCENSSKRKTFVNLFSSKWLTSDHRLKILLCSQPFVTHKKIRQTNAAVIDAFTVQRTLTIGGSITVPMADLLEWFGFDQTSKIVVHSK